MHTHAGYEYKTPLCSAYDLSHMHNITGTPTEYRACGIDDDGWKNVQVLHISEQFVQSHAVIKISSIKVFYFQLVAARSANMNDVRGLSYVAQHTRSM